MIVGVKRVDQSVVKSSVQSLARWTLIVVPLSMNKVGECCGAVIDRMWVARMYITGVCAPLYTLSVLMSMLTLTLTLMSMSMSVCVDERAMYKQTGFQK